MGSSASVSDKQAEGAEKQQKPSLEDNPADEAKLGKDIQKKPELQQDKAKQELQQQEKKKGQPQEKSIIDTTAKDKSGPTQSHKDNKISLLIEKNTKPGTNTTGGLLDFNINPKDDADSGDSSTENNISGGFSSDMEDDEFKAVCNELDEALADNNKKFVHSKLSTGEDGIPLVPTISGVRRSLEEEGYQVRFCIACNLLSFL